MFKKNKIKNFSRSDTELILSIISLINHCLANPELDASDKILYVSNYLSFIRDILGFNLERGYIYEKILQQSK